MAALVTGLEGCTSMSMYTHICIYIYTPHIYIDIDILMRIYIYTAHEEGLCVEG